MEVHLALNEKSITARSTADFPFAGLGLSLEACEEYASVLDVQFIDWTPASNCNGMALYEPPVALYGFRLLTVLGCEIRGR